MIKAISPQTQATMVGKLPRIREFEVVGVFDVGMYEYDSSFIFIPLEAAQIYFKQPKGVGKFEVMANDPENVDQVKAELAKALGPGYQLSDWQLANAELLRRGRGRAQRHVPHPHPDHRSSRPSTSSPARS